MKKILIAVAVFILLGGVGIAALIWPAYTKAKHSSDIWKSLQMAIKENQWNIVGELLADTERDLHEIKENRIIYFGTEDYTDQIADLRIDLRGTLEYYLTDSERHRRDKVCFPAGYALIEDDIVTFMKFY